MSIISFCILVMIRAIYISIPSEQAKQISSPNPRSKPLRPSPNPKSIRYFVIGKSVWYWYFQGIPSMLLIRHSRNQNYWPIRYIQYICRYRISPSISLLPRNQGSLHAVWSPSPKRRKGLCLCITQPPKSSRLAKLNSLFLKSLIVWSIRAPILSSPIKDNMKAWTHRKDSD